MIRYWLFFLLVFFAFPVFAQPGGGGGLRIGALYDKKRQKIDLKDPKLTIRAFAMADSSASAKVIQELYLENHLKLPPGDARLWILYKKETMILDLQRIIPENPVGDRDRMDSLVFRKGHFRYDRYPRDPDGKFRDNQLYREQLYHGFTPTTFKVLAPHGWIKQYKKPAKNFLAEPNLLPTFYLRRADHYAESKELDLALIDVLKARQGTLTPQEQEEALLLLYSIYLQQKEFEKAEENLSNLIRKRQADTAMEQHNGIEQLQDAYRLRINLFLAKKDLGKALAGYDSLVAISKYTNNYANGTGYFVDFNPAYASDENIERALFKLKYLQDYSGAIADLKNDINAIPEDHLSDRVGGWSEFSDTYFTLALAQYYNNQKATAWKNWLKAMEFGYGQGSGNQTVAHFDSLIQKHPEVPELYLSRALAHYKRAPYLGWGEETKTALEKALQDIDRAETLGFRDFRINLYRAMVLNLLKMPEKALPEINLAISKNNRDPRVYLHRYWIRDNLGQVKNRDQKTDPDWLKYEELIENWKFEK